MLDGLALEVGNRVRGEAEGSFLRFFMCLYSGRSAYEVLTLSLVGGVHGLVRAGSGVDKDVLLDREAFRRLLVVGDSVVKAVGDDVFVNERLTLLGSLLGSLQKFRGMWGCLPLSRLRPRRKMKGRCVLVL